MNNPLSMVDPSGYSWLSKAFRSVGGFFKKQWDSFRRDLNSVVGIVLVIAGSVIPGLQWLIPIGYAIMASPVRVIRGTDGLYLSYGYGFAGDSRESPGISAGPGSPPPMTAPPGAMSLQAGTPDVTKIGSTTITFDPALAAMRGYLNKIDPELRRMVGSLAVNIIVEPGASNPSFAGYTQWNAKRQAYVITVTPSLFPADSDPDRANAQVSAFSHELYHVVQMSWVNWPAREESMTRAETNRLRNMFDHRAYARQLRTNDFYRASPYQLYEWTEDSLFFEHFYNKCVRTNNVECTYGYGR